MKYTLLLKILFDLLGKRKVTASYLSEKYDISPRTVYRYVEELAKVAPVYVKRGRDGGVYIADNYKLPMGFMTEKEYDAVIEALNAAYARTTEERFLQAKRKISAQEKTEANELVFVGRTEDIFIDGGTWGATKGYFDKVRALRECIREKKIADVLFFIKNEPPMLRKIDPHVLVFTKNAWYVYAFCHKQRSFALFPVGKILSILKTDERFIRRPFADTDIQPPIKQATPNIEVELEIADDALSEAQAWLGADYLEQKDKKWHAVFTAANEEILAKWIVGLGGNVKVLSPSSLIKKVKKLAKETLSLYV